MTPDMAKALAISQIESLLMLAAERGVVLPDTITKASIINLDLPDLEKIRRNLHEVVYAPPLRNR